jgi:hypothetical protein
MRLCVLVSLGRHCLLARAILVRNGETTFVRTPVPSRKLALSNYLKTVPKFPGRFLPAHHPTALDHRLGDQRGPHRLRPQERRHVSPLNQRPLAHPRLGLGGPQGTTLHRETFRAVQDGPRDRARLLEKRGTHRGSFLPLFSRPIGPSPGRTGVEKGHDPGEYTPTSALSRGPGVRPSDDGTNPQALRLDATQRPRPRKRVVQVFDPKLSDLQREVLRLLAVPASAYRSSHQ